MIPQDAFKRICDLVYVGRTDVAAAKAFILDKVSFEEVNSTELIDSWLRTLSYARPQRIHLDQASEEMLISAARYISLVYAGHYALLELVREVLLFPVGGTPDRSIHIEYQHLSGSSGWTFEKFKCPNPDRVRKPIVSYLKGPFIDGDLYLKEINILHLHPGIEQALRDAVVCYRHDLFNSVVAMLGAASEGAWVELGIVLSKALPSHTKVRKVTSEATGYRSMPRLLKAMTELFEETSLCGDLLNRSNVRLEDVRAAATWSETVRDARNVLHWGVLPALVNSFEKVSMLLVSAPPNLRTIWAIYEQGKSMSERNISA